MAAACPPPKYGSGGAPISEFAMPPSSNPAGHSNDQEHATFLSQSDLEARASKSAGSPPAPASWRPELLHSQWRPFWRGSRRASQNCFRFRALGSGDSSLLEVWLLIACLGVLAGNLNPALADSLWHDPLGYPVSMFADKRAMRVGDIVTILVQENTTATKANSTATSKASSVNSALSSFLYSPAASSLLTKKGLLPTMAFSGNSTFAGSGTINNSEQIVSSVAVRIVDVLPNRNFIIEGTRQNSFGDEQQTIILRGTIRQDDIMGNNTIYSYNIADATIKIVSHGTITDSQRKGWFHRLWDKFAPF